MTAAGSPTRTLSALRVDAGQVTLLDVERLELAIGRRLVVFGPNGAGKSTLLRLLAGFPVGDGRSRRSPLGTVAYLPQRPYVLRGPAGRTLGLGLDDERAAWARQLAERLGLDARLLHGEGTRLSGGERQRIALARTLADPAPWVLLDEPLAPIDVADRPRVARVVLEATAGRGTIIVTHDRDEAVTLGDELAVLVDGRIRQRGPVEQVFALPGDAAVAEALGVGNAVIGEIVGVDGPLREVAAGPVRIWGLGDGAVGDRARALFGAETVTLFAGEAPPGGSARNRWRGTVVDVRRAGRLVEVVVDVGRPIVALVTPGSADGLALESGTPVTATVKATAVRVLGT